MFSQCRSTEFIDPLCIQDIFAEKIGMVEDLGHNFRFIFTARNMGENHAVCRLIIPTLNVPQCRIITDEAWRRSSVLCPSVVRSVAPH